MSHRQILLTERMKGEEAGRIEGKIEGKIEGMTESAVTAIKYGIVIPSVIAAIGSISEEEAAALIKRYT